MFEVEKDVLDLRFNMQKVKTLESMQGVSLMGELRSSGGLLSLQVLEGLFAVGLYNTTQDQAVKGKKAVEIYNSLMESEGYSNIVAVTIGKLQEDMGFLFRNN
ncbi:segregation and condensation protein B [Planococcus sp. X10-3]|uniref:segregation and condensation protein B n=1 Tax=Planococcus sp. X10-3 TaxID=3061240 RepID=UPI003BB04ECF